MSPYTIFLSRLIGLFALIASVAEIIHKTAMIETAAELAEAPPLLFIAGTFMLLGGLAMVLSHNVWTGGAATVIVTIIGWLLLIRGIVFVFISPGGAAAIFEALHFARFYYFYVAIPMVLGLYLTYAGFTARRR